MYGRVHAVRVAVKMYAVVFEPFDFFKDIFGKDPGQTAVVHPVAARLEVLKIELLGVSRHNRCVEAHYLRRRACLLADNDGKRAVLCRGNRSTQTRYTSAEDQHVRINSLIVQAVLLHTQVLTR